jgi:OOP family OmpA-OmpF porin
VGVGVPLWQHLSLEGNFFMANLDTGTLNQNTLGNSDFYQRGGGADLVWGFRQQNQFNPFVIAGIGAVYDDVLPKSEKTTSFLYDAGLGFTNPLFGNPATRLRGDARVLHDDFNGGKNDWRVGLALEVSLGSAPEERVVMKEVRVPVQVVPMPAQIPMPALIAVPPAPVDSDGDGVPDDLDLCPNTPHGVKVDDHGCAIGKQTLTLENVEFDFNSAHLRSSSDSTLDETANFLRSQPNIEAEIAGYTDSIGSATANLKLSRERAASVKNYLVAQGVDSSRLTSKGFGKANPVASNSSEEGRQKNRRVEFIILSGANR